MRDSISLQQNQQAVVDGQHYQKFSSIPSSPLCHNDHSFNKHHNPLGSQSSNVLNQQNSMIYQRKQYQAAGDEYNRSSFSVQGMSRQDQSLHNDKYILNRIDLKKPSTVTGELCDDPSLTRNLDYVKFRHGSSCTNSQSIPKHQVTTGYQQTLSHQNANQQRNHSFSLQYHDQMNCNPHSRSHEANCTGSIAQDGHRLGPMTSQQRCLNLKPAQIQQQLQQHPQSQQNNQQVDNQLGSLKQQLYTQRELLRKLQEHRMR